VRKTPFDYLCYVVGFAFLIVGLITGLLGTPTLHKHIFASESSSPTEVFLMAIFLLLFGIGLVISAIWWRLKE